MLGVSPLKVWVVSKTMAESMTVEPDSRYTSHDSAVPVSTHDRSNEVGVMLKNCIDEGRGQVGCMKAILSMAAGGAVPPLASLAQAKTSFQLPLVGTKNSAKKFCHDDWRFSLAVLPVRLMNPVGRAALLQL